MNTGSFFRRIIFLTFALTLALVYLLINFKGLNTADGMEKAQMGREIARGSYQTKMIRPISVWQNKTANENDGYLVQTANSDSYNSPLYPLTLGIVFKAIGADNFEKWRMGPKKTIYDLDRVVVMLSVAFLLISIYFIYLSVKNLFDETVAGVVALLITASQLLWSLTQTGMPNMMMFMFFSAACYFIVKALQETAAGRSGYIMGTVAGVCIVLLCLTHWMGIWILIGFLIFSAFYIKPYNTVAVSTGIIAALLFAFPLYQNYKHSGTPFGTAYLMIYNGLGSGEDAIMRSLDNDVALSLRNLIMSILKEFFSQFSNVFQHTGFLITVPMFLLALAHQFKNKVINDMKWGLLIMWTFASLGMAIFGVSNYDIASSTLGQEVLGLRDDIFHKNQLHFLFGPMMAAFGMSIVVIIWTRTTYAQKGGAAGNLHVLLVCIIGVLPITLSLPDEIFRGLFNKGPRPNWIPYDANALNTTIPKAVKESEYILSDQPWATAWYADRKSIWTPKKLSEINQLRAMANREKTPIVGILVSPLSHGTNTLMESYVKSPELISFALDGWVSIATGFKKPIADFLSETESTRALASAYPYASSLSGPTLVFYSSKNPSEFK